MRSSVSPYLLGRGMVLAGHHQSLEVGLLESSEAVDKEPLFIHRWGAVGQHTSCKRTPDRLDLGPMRRRSGGRGGGTEELEPLRVVSDPLQEFLNRPIRRFNSGLDHGHGLPVANAGHSVDELVQQRTGDSRGHGPTPRSDEEARAQASSCRARGGADS
jgi:hypothetical protein